MARKPVRGYSRSLFDVPPVRNSDPPTSHAAAAELVDTLANRQAFALEWVGNRPGCTAAELERAANCRDGMIRKRLKELERAGSVKPGEPKVCSVTARKCQTWWPA